MAPGVLAAALVAAGVFDRRVCDLTAGCPATWHRAPLLPPPGNATGKLYVSNQAANSILRFDGASTASANVVPGATIAGGATQLSSPQYLFVDQAADRLFVANAGEARS